MVGRRRSIIPHHKSRQPVVFAREQLRKSFNQLKNSERTRWNYMEGHEPLQIEIQGEGTKRNQGQRARGNTPQPPFASPVASSPDGGTRSLETARRVSIRPSRRLIFGEMRAVPQNRQSYFRHKRSRYVGSLIIPERFHLARVASDARDSYAPAGASRCTPTVTKTAKTPLGSLFVPK